MFNINGKVAVITGGYGVLGASMAQCLAERGAHVVIIGRKPEKGEALAEKLSTSGNESIFCQADVLDRNALIQARETIMAKWGHIDILINAAGGNMPGAIIMPDKSFLDIDFSAFEGVMNLNLMGTVIPTVVFGEQMAKQ
jgi:NAD(P)-dependent dehydrogenase (short-subunit alcohol dehydrogenase family)